MSAFRSTLRTTATLGLVGAMICMGGTASAETAPGSAGYIPSATTATEGYLPMAITPAQAAGALNELRASFGSARHVDAAGTETFQLSEGITMRFEKDTTQRIGGGMDGWKPYVEFNHTEQGMLVSGATAGLRAAI